MSKIVLIGRNEALLQKCAERLRWRGYKVYIHEDLMDGLRETMVISVGCIIWSVDSNEPARARKYKALQRYHRYTPVIIIDNNRSDYEPDIDPDTYFINEKPSVDEVVDKVVSLIRPQSTYVDDDESEETEAELGMLD